MQPLPSRDPYGSALSAVRRQARLGRFSPGEAIVVTELAAEVGFSPTPVREALACLAGEGMLERRRGRGYFYPALTAAEAIDLFELQRAYLHGALTLHPRGLAPLRKAVGGVDVPCDIQAFFQVIIAQSGNSALTTAHDRLVLRLGEVHRLERRADLAVPGLLAELITAAAEGDVAALVASLERHHERRCARIRALLDNTEPADPQVCRALPGGS